MTDDPRVGQLLDRARITELKFAFARAADAGDADAMVGHFTESCAASYDPSGRAVEGRAALRDWYASKLGPVVASSHHLSNVEVTFTDADTATLRCYLYSWQRFAGHPDLPDKHRWGRYLDTWVRVDDDWRQSSLTLLVAGEAGGDAGDAPRVGEYLGRF